MMMKNFKDSCFCSTKASDCSPTQDSHFSSPDWSICQECKIRAKNWRKTARKCWLLSGQLSMSTNKILTLQGNEKKNFSKKTFLIFQFFSRPSRDLIDAYLGKMNEMTEEESQEFFHGFDPNQQLEQIVLDLFSAGVETMKTSMLWAILYMLHNPQVINYFNLLFIWIRIIHPIAYNTHFPPI